MPGEAKLDIHCPWCQVPLMEAHDHETNLAIHYFNRHMQTRGGVPMCFCGTEVKNVYELHRHWHGRGGFEAHLLADSLGVPDGTQKTLPDLSRADE